jgi:GNAT superfamily N-acetyltransferase
VLRNTAPTYQGRERLCPVAHNASVNLTITPLSATALRPLRRRVLRPHQTLDELEYPGENHPDAGHLGALLDGRVVGAVTVVPEAREGADPRWWRLRGMATDPDLQGRGIGTRLVAAARGHVAAHGGTGIWCHARSPAAPFYVRQGFVQTGEEWEEPLMGPHVAMHWVFPTD